MEETGRTGKRTNAEEERFWTMGWMELSLIGLAAVAGGLANAVAGGGTLITFPALTLMGVPPVAANVTNTVALCPGYLGATFAQLKDLREQRRRMWLFLPVCVLGGIGGGVLLLNTGEQVFRELVPYLILFATLLLAAQDRLRGWLVQRTAKGDEKTISEWWAVLPLFFASTYGGYFGAGMSIIVLAALALSMDDSMTRLSALKQSIAFTVNIAAAVFFLFSGQIQWLVALVMAVGALVGGSLGGRLASRIDPIVLKRIVITVGLLVTAIYLVR